MKIAVVIPFFDEAAVLPGTLDALRHALDANDPFDATDVIAVDGGSRDASRALISRHSWVRVLGAPLGRASQMNAAAHAGDADVLLFLHADCRLPVNGLTAIDAAVKRGSLWGRFDVAIEGRSRLLSTVSAFMNFRSRLTGIATGDQAIFVTRDAFDKIGGFPTVPLMEDVALSKALLRTAGRPACLRDRVVTSGRRWDSHGALRTIVSMWRLRFDYWRGVDPNALARRYRPVAAAARPVLQVFAKDPQPTKVKTRLARTLGDDAAASLYRELVERTLTTAVAARTAGIVTDVELWCDPDPQRNAFVDWSRRYRVKLKGQRGTGLGERMHHALASALAHQRPALLIGTDCPALDTRYLARAATALATHDVVIGPAEDGGYVLVGLARAIDIFADIPWSTAEVMAATRAKVAAQGARYCELEPLWDVDTPADVARFNSLRRRPMGLAFPWRRRPAESRLDPRRS